ncbi:MAG: cellulose biosynthesis cyclic di-GMP-binding regulatory protein BcsB [Anaerolineales bacterium]|nr:cellulose biosynthesis cyclic di-GMP-binding regulatory protein BcsB [Anaerolineales bacterium]
MIRLSAFTARPPAIALLCVVIIVSTGLISARPLQVGPQFFEITFADLGYREYTMHGPNYRLIYSFNIPADWQPQEGSSLNLNMLYQIASRERQTAYSTLTVRLNNKVLTILTLETPGELREAVPLSPEDLFLIEDQTINRLELVLDVYEECEFAWLVSLIVRDSSYLHFNYITKPLTLDLDKYPAPLYQDRAFQSAPIRFILSDKPSAAELQAATMIAAKLGELTGNALPIVASTYSNFQNQALTEEHFYIIGQPRNNPLIYQLDLPLYIEKRQLDLRSEIPAIVVPGEAFTVTVTVKNSSSASENLILESRWPLGVDLKSCQGQCSSVTPGLIRWAIGKLEAGQEVSNQMQMYLDPDLALLGEMVEHTSSLLNSDGNIINVDTLTATISSSQPETIQQVSSQTNKDPYIFAANGHGIPESTGIIQEIISPWSDRHIAIVATGVSDEAVLKAGRALGAETDFPGMAGPYALVQQTIPFTQTTTKDMADISFAELGYEDETMTIFFDQLEYRFRIPSGWELGNDTNLALHFAHGAALSVISSTLEIAMNDVPISSIFLNENNIADTWVTIPLPKQRLDTGINDLQFLLSGTFDKCIDEKLARGFWLTIYSDTFLHLPHKPSPSEYSLDDFPYPFTQESSLSNVIFMLPEQPAESDIEDLLQIASYLGDAALGTSFIPQVEIGGNPEEAQLLGYHAIAIGRPTANPYISAANDSLPQPFIPGTDEIRQQLDQVIYRLTPGYSLGYIQLLLSPWDQDKALLAVTGSTDEGKTWAANLLVNDEINYDMEGNLVILVRDGEYRSTDTRQQQPIEGGEDYYAALATAMAPEATLSPTTTAEPLTPSATPPPSLGSLLTPQQVPTETVTTGVGGQPSWLILLLLASVIIILVSVGIYLRRMKS